MAWVHDDIHAKKSPIIYFFSDDFGFRSPAIQKHFRQKKVYLHRTTRLVKWQKGGTS